jgi:hypothetical protein
VLAGGVCPRRRLSVRCGACTLGLAQWSSPRGTTPGATIRGQPASPPACPRRTPRVRRHVRTCGPGRPRATRASGPGQVAATAPGPGGRRLEDRPAGAAQQPCAYHTGIPVRPPGAAAGVRGAPDARALGGGRDTGPAVPGSGLRGRGNARALAAWLASRPGPGAWTPGSARAVKSGSLAPPRMPVRLVRNGRAGVMRPASLA